MSHADLVFDHRDHAVETTRWRTLAVFAHTLSGSGRVLVRSAVGRAHPHKVDRIIDRWCAHTFRLAGATLTRTGHEGLGEPCVLISNHRSLLDVPAICATFPGRVRFVAKAELRRVPGFGAAMARAGIVFVERADRTAAIQALGHAWERIGPDTSLWIAAQGTRTDDDELGPLKKGPFHVAVAGGVPLVPVWIEGSAAVLPARSLGSTTGQRVQVRYGTPIPTLGATVDDLPALIATAEAALLALRGR